jgi:hypothetical protein
MAQRFDKKVNARVVQALNNIISQEGVSLLALAKELGFAYSSLCSIKSMNRGVSENLILLLEKYKNINPTWLKDGRDNMFLAKKRPQDELEKQIEALTAQVEYFKEKYEDQKHVNKLLENTIKDKQEVITQKDLQISTYKDMHSIKR